MQENHLPSIELNNYLRKIWTVVTLVTFQHSSFLNINGFNNKAAGYN